MELDKIISGCKGKKRKSQDALVRQYAPLLMAVCIRYCNDREIAKDALQETFINIFKYIDSYAGTGSFEGWMRRIAVNCSYAYLKKIKKVRFHEDISEHKSIVSTIPDVYSQLGKEEVLKLIKKLPKGQYLVFNMKIIEGYSHAEIAKTLNITASTSRSNLTRARANLIALMNKNHELQEIAYR